ncbi:TPA: FAD-dependent monooxygenase [Salmonella enterica]
MTRYTTTDVLICGAGVTGLTLAIELARHGVSFRLIEKRTTPFIGSRGKGIQPRTQEIFEDLGILNKVVAAGGLYPRLRTYRHDGSYVDSDIAHHTKPTHAEPYHLPLMVPQNVTETIMREQLKAWGHRVEFGCELRHFAQTPRTVTAYVAGPAGEEVIIAHYLIGADGGGSFVRKKLGVSFPGRTLGIHALVADASLSGLNRDVWRGIKRERDVQQLDIQYTNSPLAHTLPERQHGLQAGERAPDAPLLGAGGQSLRLFQLLQGPDWNLLAYETHGKVIDARRGLRIHHIGEQDELIDTLGHFRESYHLAPGQCVLIRPDGYVGAFFHGKQSNDIENYLSRFAIGIKDEY